jgi:hypothetical protein
LRKHTESEQIKLWSSTLSSSNEKITDDYDIKFNKELTTQTKTSTVLTEIGSEIISKAQLYTNEIEVELNKIEQEWKSKFKLDDEKKEVNKVSKTSIFKRSLINDKNKQSFELTNQPETDVLQSSLPKQDFEINKKFLQSTQIHQKPKDFYHLAKIFKISNQASTNNENNELNITDETSMNQLLFIEYLIERIRLLLTDKSKEYLTEKQSNEKTAIQVERVREEKLKQYEEYITKKNVWFSEILTDENNSGKKSNPAIRNTDDSEAEMQAKIDFLLKNEQSDHSDLQINETNSLDINSNEAKKPLPDFNKIRDEAIKQQLKIKEFFMPSHSKKQVQFKEDFIEEEETEDYKQSILVNIKETNEEIVRILPTVDSLSQLEIRRKIFYDKLVK